MTFFNSNPKLEKSWNFNSSTREAQISIIIPVFNQAENISVVLDSVLKNILIASELIVINDGSEDETQYMIVNYLNRLEQKDSPNLIKVRLFTLRYSKFETFCDDFGIKNSSANYCLEIQADMVIQDLGFDQRMLKLMLSFPDIALLSGRGVEQLEPIVLSYQESLGAEAAFFLRKRDFLEQRSSLLLKNSLRRIIKYFTVSDVGSITDNTSQVKEFEIQSDNDFLRLGQAGRLGDLIDLQSHIDTTQPPKVYLGETVMRGPLLIDKEKYLELGGFSTEAFFLGFDDHDFCLRANLKNYRVGYTPVNFSAPLKAGSTRKNRTALSEFLIFLNIVRIGRFREKTHLSKAYLESLPLER
jgi:glycosyltransferase involved in cell wall biosynthesis